MYVCGGLHPLVLVLYKAMRLDGEKEEDVRQSDGRKDQGGREGKKGRTSEHRQRSIPAQFCGPHPISQTGYASHLEDFAAATTHPQRAPGAVPVLILIISVADCALYGCMLVA